MAMSRMTGPLVRGTPKIRGLLPMEGVVAPQAGTLGRVFDQQMEKRPASGCEPGVGSAAHPVVGVAEGYEADSALLGEVDGASHGDVGVEVAYAVVAVQRSREPKAVVRWVRRLRRCCRCGLARRSGGKRLKAVGVDAVTGGLGEEAGAVGGSVAGEAEVSMARWRAA